MVRHIQERILRRSANVFTVMVDLRPEVLETALQYLANMTEDERPSVTWGTSLLSHDGKILMATVVVFPTIPFTAFPISGDEKR